MKTLARCLFASVAIAAAPGLALAAEADPNSLGAREYLGSCAVCHGTDGKGKGPYSSQLKHDLPDMTQLAKGNDADFPLARIYKVIDGRADVKAHGPRDMPIWGNEYNDKARAFHIEYFGKLNAESFIQTRILALVSYLNEIQER